MKYFQFGTRYKRELPNLQESLAEKRAAGQGVEAFQFIRRSIIMMKSKNPKIKFNKQTLEIHAKASEKYVDVTLSFPDKEWSGWIPVEYRRTGVDLKTEDEMVKHVEDIYSMISSLKQSDWLKNEEKFWKTEKPRASTTKGFFDVLALGGWKCTVCTLPQNRNFARRIQDLKEFGYTIATDTNRSCPNCKKKTTQLILLPIPRVMIAGNGYETWTPALRKRILNVLDHYDAYEGKKGQHLLPDHKFSEIRWDEHTKAENPDSMTDSEIKEKFQLMTNQRNQQKREACRNCFSSGLRGYPFGIKYYFSGNEKWDKSIPEKGKAAEKGCQGCGWYDLEKWRRSVIEKLES